MFAAWTMEPKRWLGPSCLGVVCICCIGCHNEGQRSQQQLFMKLDTDQVIRAGVA